MLPAGEAARALRAGDSDRRAGQKARCTYIFDFVVVQLFRHARALGRRRALARTRRTRSRARADEPARARRRSSGAVPEPVPSGWHARAARRARPFGSREARGRGKLRYRYRLQFYCFLWAVGMCTSKRHRSSPDVGARMGCADRDADDDLAIACRHMLRLPDAVGSACAALVGLASDVRLDRVLDWRGIGAGGATALAVAMRSSAVAIETLSYARCGSPLAGAIVTRCPDCAGQASASTARWPSLRRSRTRAVPSRASSAQTAARTASRIARFTACAASATTASPTRRTARWPGACSPTRP